MNEIGNQLLKYQRETLFQLKTNFDRSIFQ